MQIETLQSLTVQVTEATLLDNVNVMQTLGVATAARIGHTLSGNSAANMADRDQHYCVQYLIIKGKVGKTRCLSDTRTGTSIAWLRMVL